jgi:pyruvate dehydrogenase E2 component (dihydrolipoamide acetyltransferase)
LADITMPQLGETVTEGTVTRWLKQVGDQIAEDDVLFEVSTDKVDSEVPSPSAGYLSEILVQEGETVDVGTKLAVISAEPPSGGSGDAAPEAAEETPAEPPSGGSGDAAPEAAEETPAEPAKAQTDQADGAEPDRAEEEQPAATDAGDDAQAAQAAPADQAAEQDSEDKEPAPAPAAPPSSQRPVAGGPAGPGGTRPADDRPPSGPGSGGPSKVLSPVVRRLIAEHNLDPSQIQGSGAGGRITRADVLALIDRQGTTAGNGGPASAPAEPQAQPAPTQKAPTQAAPAQKAAPPAAEVTAGERDTVVPFTNIRRRTAEHMVRSKQTSAHTVVVMEVDYSGVEKVRQASKQKFKEQEGFGLTFLPFISRAVIDAIGEWPNLNSSVGNDELIVHSYVNLGIAVDLNFEGLLVPVIHDADGKRLRALAREISALAGKARSKRLTMDDISGGTFTITNAGPFGTFMTVPVINQPQTAILSTDGVRKRPVVVESPEGDDAIAIHPVGNLVLSFDHRAFDGAYASAFMAAVKEILETRDWSAEL